LKKKRKREGPTVSVDTTTVSSDVETINIEEEEDDVKSPNASTERVVQTPKVVGGEERSRSARTSRVTHGRRRGRGRHPLSPSILG
jgi:hypothetical protein